MWINFDEQELAEIETQLRESGNTALANRVAKKVAQFTPDEIDQKYIDYAQSQSRDGEIETDPGAVVSRGSDPGAYVMSWRWFYAKDAGVPEDEATV